MVARNAPRPLQVSPARPAKSGYTSAVLGDVELLEAWRSGDKRAANELLRRHFASLHRFFRSKLDSDVDELIQRTMLASLKGQHQFRGESSFRRYLLTIARHELYAYFRHRKQGQDIDFGVSSVADLATSPSGVLGKRRRQKIILLALRRLPLDLQIVVELHYWEELTGSQIAEVLEIPVGTAKTRIARAKQMLSSLITEAFASQDATDETVDNIDAWVVSMRDEWAGDEDGEAS